MTLFCVYYRLMKEADVADLIDTTEMYLKTILELEEDGVTPLRARIVDRLGHSGPTVSQTVARMERDGLLHVMGDRRLELTDTGRAHATEVLRKHRLAERLLLDVIGMDWAQVHDEACRWEHVMSDAVEARLEELLTNTCVDPYGNPMPGCAPLEGAYSAELAVRSLEAGALTLARIGERTWSCSPPSMSWACVRALAWASRRTVTSCASPLSTRPARFAGT